MTDGYFLKVLRALDIPEPVPEYRFHPDRRWRLDYAWPDHKLAVEIEGGAWIQGRHTRGSGFLNDISKYNELTLAGWRLLRFTPAQLRDGSAILVIAKWFEGKGG